MLPLCIYITTGPCMQYSTGPCTTVPCILYYWPMYTVLNVPVKSASDMCIQYFWSVYTVLNISVYSILLGNANCTMVHHVGYWSICMLLFWSVYTVLMVREYSCTGLCIEHWGV